MSSYVKVGEYQLPTLSHNPLSTAEFEASAVTWNKDTNNLFMLGDSVSFITETTLTGTVLGTTKLAAGSSAQGHGFYDPEGLTYIGGGKLVLTEERYRTAVQFTHAANTLLTRAQAATVNLGTTVGNIGLEGITYEPLTGGSIFVNETSNSGDSLQNIFQTQINFRGRHRDDRQLHGGQQHVVVCSRQHCL